MSQKINFKLWYEVSDDPTHTHYPVPAVGDSVTSVNPEDIRDAIAHALSGHEIGKQQQSLAQAYKELPPEAASYKASYVPPLIQRQVDKFYKEFTQKVLESESNKIDKIIDGIVSNISPNLVTQEDGIRYYAFRKIINKEQQSGVSQNIALLRAKKLYLEKFLKNVHPHIIRAAMVKRQQLLNNFHKSIEDYEKEFGARKGVWED